jgi:hypothetical protein
MEEYIMHGRPVGGFLTAVLSNDLVGAFAKADDINAKRMFDYANFLYNQAPIPAWGSKEKIEEWMEKGGMNGSE